MLEDSPMIDVAVSAPRGDLERRCASGCTLAFFMISAPSLSCRAPTFRKWNDSTTGECAFTRGYGSFARSLTCLRWSFRAQGKNDPREVSRRGAAG